MGTATRWLKDIGKRRAFGVCAYLLATDRAAAVRYSIGRVNTDSGTTHSSLSLAESIAYINDVFDDYKRYSGVETFHGRAAEVGPGDNCGVALRFLADGCERVDLADRFCSRRDTSHQLRIYQKMIELHPELRRWCKRYPPADESAFEGIYRFYGKDASAEKFFVDHGPYDVIFSRATLEHLFDPISALSSMVAALRRGALLLHKVDLNDHAMFSHSFHELKFLEVPDRLYPLMTRGSGRPNRVLVNQYRSCLQGAGLEVSFLVTRLAGAGEIVPHRSYQQISREQRERSLAYVRSVRPRLARSLRSVSDEDLSVSGFFIVAKKP